MNPKELSRQELEDLYDAAVQDKAIFRVVVQNPDLWRALSEVGRDRGRAKWGKWYPVVATLRAIVMWPLRIITAPFKGYV